MTDPKAEQQDLDESQKQDEIEKSPEVLALEEKIAQQAKTNERLLEESKLNKSKRQELEADAAQKQQDDLKAKGKTDELLEIEIEKNLKLQKKISEKDNKLLDKDLRLQIDKFAPDANDSEDIYDLLPEGVVNIDREAGTISGVDEAIRQIREKKPYLFKKASSPDIGGKLPTVTKEKVKTLGEMTREEKHKKVLENRQNQK